MVSVRLAWSALWLSLVGAFAFSYWRMDRARTEAWRVHFTRWGQWTEWREKRIAEEFAVSKVD